VFFNFTAATTAIVPASATDVRRRNHTYNNDYEDSPPIGPLTPNPVLFPSGQNWSVRITDDDGAGNVGWRTARPDWNTDLDITVNGIRDDDLDPLSQMPDWFLDNNWHQFVHAAISGANLPASPTTSGTGTCVVPPAGNTTDQCLTVRLNAAATPVDVRDDVAALVIASGPALAGQDRVAGTPPCTSHPNFLCDYFETPNDDDEGASRNLVFGRALRDTLSVTATYNDQVRTVPP